MEASGDCIRTTSRGSSRPSQWCGTPVPGGSGFHRRRERAVEIHDRPPDSAVRIELRTARFEATVAVAGLSTRSEEPLKTEEEKEHVHLLEGPVRGLHDRGPSLARRLAFDLDLDLAVAVMGETDTAEKFPAPVADEDEIGRRCPRFASSGSRRNGRVCPDAGDLWL